MLPIDKSCNVLTKLVNCFYSGSLNLELLPNEVDDFTWSRQDDFLKITLDSVLMRKYPVKNEFVKLFLKKVIKYLENGYEVHDNFYKYLCTAMSKDVEKFYYRHYVIGNEFTLSNIITLKETNNMVINGTTGMQTWEAAFMLSDWALNHREIFDGKSILELGSGIGFTGITLAKLCKPLVVYMSDCHEDVLKTLEENIKINFPDNCRTVVDNNKTIYTKNESRIGIFNLDWTQVDINCETSPDVIIGSDIIYDPSIIQPLCNVLQLFCSKNKNIEIYIAGVKRNEETYEIFLRNLELRCFSYEDLPLEKCTNLVWDENLLRYLLKIKICS